MKRRNRQMLLCALAVAAPLCLTNIGCATKKHVRESVSPLQDQVNKTQARVDSLQKQTDANRQSIGDLDREIATTSEKANDASKKAAEAAEAAARANAAAAEAARKAAEADAHARQAQQDVAGVDRTLQSISNNSYKLDTTEQVFFVVGQSALTKDETAKLDSVVAKLGSMKNYVVEIQGFADSTGDKALNRELSRRRADAVVHYLAVEHSVPLRTIRQLGVGSEFPGADNKTRAARKSNRRVDVKIYTLELVSRSTQ